MQNIRSKGTIAECLMMRELRREKIYFAKNVASIAGKPDIVFRKKKTVVFIDSDFWHGHPRRLIMPKTNRKYWVFKIASNRQRDKEVNKQLKKEGWKVLRFWEYDVKRNIGKCIGKIIKAVR
jgi:DNA mismatch endonuclease (patch repair protein)